MHNETRISYEEAKPVLDTILAGSERPEWIEFSRSEKFRNLFLHRVWNPMGYEDGGSFAQYERVRRRYNVLDTDEKETILEIATHIVDYQSQRNGEMGAEERQTALLTANQLLQHPKMIDRYRNQDTRKTTDLAQKIARDYSSNTELKVPQWDAQMAENRGYWHIGEMNDHVLKTIMGSAVSGLATIGGVHLMNPELASSIAMDFSLPVGIAGLVGMFSHGPLLAAQDITKSPVFNEGLISGKHYRFARHPLYGAAMVSSTLLGIASLNPVGLWSSAKTLYHGSRGCQEQDTRLKTLFSNEAKEFQEKTPAVVPGVKMLMKGLKKILPENLTRNLERPISDYLAKIPHIAKEPEIEELISARNPNTQFASPLIAKVKKRYFRNEIRKMFRRN